MKVGVVVGKFCIYVILLVLSFVKEIVKKWRDVVEEIKKKRKRVEGDEGKDVKKEKEEGNGKWVKVESMCVLLLVVELGSDIYIYFVVGLLVVILLVSIFVLVFIFDVKVIFFFVC